MKKDQRKLTFNPLEAPHEGDWGRVGAGVAPVSGIAQVLHVDKRDGVALVQFIASAKALHDGNVGPVRGKNHHCWWVSLDDVTPIIEDCVVLRNGREMLAMVGSAFGTAKCCEGEEFDKLTGAIIALSRAFGKDPTAAAMKVLEVMSAVKKEEEPKSKLHVRYNDGQYTVDYGTVGEPTPFKDERGVSLLVGDEVIVKNEHTGRSVRSWVVKNKGDGPFIMGICAACHGDTGKVDRPWRIILDSTCKERVVGEDKPNYHLVITEEGGPKPESKADARNKKEVRA